MHLMETIKIAKYLALCGIASRRKCEDLVKEGSVRLNGKILTNVAKRINPGSDIILFNGKPVKAEKKVYFLLNKPAGYTTTASDPHAEKLVTSLVPMNPAVFPVGRLDKYTSGLLILTNDGALAQKLTHPKFEIKKEYLINTNYPLTDGEVAMVKKGLALEDGFIKPDNFEQIGKKEFRIVLHSGKKRIVRRIIEKIGKKVAELHRVKIENLGLENLKPGEWKKITIEEILKLTAKNA